MKLLREQSIKIIFLSLVIFSCQNNLKENKHILVGNLLWVNESMEDSVIKVAVKETIENSSVIVCQISWSPNDKRFFSNVEWYYNLAEESNKPFMLNIDWMSPNRSSTNGDWSFESKEMRELFDKDISTLVKNYNPEFLTLGIEVNYYALICPNGYKEFVTLFNSIKTQLKKQYPSMKIGLSFQLELLYGVHDGWKGNKAIEPLTVIDDNCDYIGISLYPDIAESGLRQTNFTDYLDSVCSITPQPIGISETGMSSIHFKESTRVNFLNQIYNKAEKFNMMFVIWGTVNDDVRFYDWKSRLGMIDVYGVPKKEYLQWKKRNKNLIDKVR